MQLARRRNDRTSTIIKAFGQWHVTSYGLESTGVYYPISKDRLSEPHWIEHMAWKNWLIMADFQAALGFAKEYFKTEEALP